MPEVDFRVGDDEARIAGWSQGDGRGVLLLHGGPGLSDYTDALLPELQDGYQVVRYQQRGLSPSTTEGPFDIATQVEDAIRVLDHLDLDRPLLAGHSWGGHLAMHLLVSHPERCSGALIIDPLGAIPDGGGADLGRNLMERVGAAAAAKYAELEARAEAGEALPGDALEQLRLVWPGYFADADAAPPMPEMRLSAHAYQETYASIVEHFERGTLVTGLPQVEIPAAFLLGAASPIPNSFGAQSADLMADAEVRVLPQVGHMVWVERPGAVREELDRLAARTA